MNDKKHFYLAAVQVAYIKDDAPKQRTMNIVVQSPVKRITYNDMNSARKGCITRIMGEAEVTVEAIRDVVFLSFTYLGLMTEAQFNDQESSNNPF